MTRLGLDYSFSHPSPNAIRAAGYTFVCRYLSRNASKNLTAAELAGLRAAGLDVVLNWEASTNAALNGHGQGVSDAQAAAAQAADLGLDGSPIYFSVDFDAASSQQPAINSYFDGVASVLGLARTGGYGGYYVIQRLFDAGKIVWGWQTYAWSGGRWDSRAHIRQTHNGITVGGADCDADQAMVDDFGQVGGSDVITEADWTYENVNVLALLKRALADGNVVPGMDSLPAIVGWEVNREAREAQTQQALADLQTQVAGMVTVVNTLAGAIKSGGGDLDTAAIIAAVQQQGTQTSTLVQSLQAQVKSLQAELATAAQAAATALKS